MRPHYKVPRGSQIIPTAHGLRKPHILLRGLELKHCSRCDDWKTLDHYWGNATNWDGLQCLCNDCEYALNQANLERNKR